MKTPLTRSQYNTDILAKRYAEKVITLNLKIIDCLAIEAYEDAAKLRDEIMDDLEKTAQYISELTGIEATFVKEMLVRNNQKIFDTLKEHNKA
ncbi:MAG: hypothetical protein H7141_08965 [Burkholderiales bacterium]|nr:hypothetical protein [Bacteroidia bacterium]